MRLVLTSHALRFHLLSYCPGSTRTKARPSDIYLDRALDKLSWLHRVPTFPSGDPRRTPLQYGPEHEGLSFAVAFIYLKYSLRCMWYPRRILRISQRTIQCCPCSDQLFFPLTSYGTTRRGTRPVYSIGMRLIWLKNALHRDLGICFLLRSSTDVRAP